MNLAVVILHYGSVARSQRLEESLRCADSSGAGLFVFDNAAPEPYAGAAFLAESNVYWAGALTLCVEHLRARGYTHLWFLNNDIELLGKPPFVQRARVRMEWIAREQGQALGIWSPCVLHNPYYPHMQRNDRLCYAGVRLVDGIAPVYSLDCLTAIGGVDALDNPYGYGVDMWIALRADAAGWPVVVDHEYCIRHEYHSTARQIDGFMAKAAAAEEAYLRTRLGTQWRAILRNASTEQHFMRTTGAVQP